MTYSLLSEINVQTTGLIDLLNVQIVSSKGGDEEMIELGTTRGEIGEEPGERDILAGLSSTGSVQANGPNCECVGQFSEPFLIRTVAAKILVAGLSASIGELPKEDQDEQFITVSLLRSDEDDSLALKVVPYDPNGDDTDPTEQRLKAYPAGSYNGSGYGALVSGRSSDTVQDEDGFDLPDGPLAVFRTADLKTLVGIAAKEKAKTIKVFRHGHAASNHQFEIGSVIGAIQPVKYGVDADVDSVFGDVHLPEPAATLPGDDEDDDDGN